MRSHYTSADVIALIVESISAKRDASQRWLDKLISDESIPREEDEVRRREVEIQMLNGMILSFQRMHDYAKKKSEEGKPLILSLDEVKTRQGNEVDPNLSAGNWDYIVKMSDGSGGTD